MAVYLEIRAFCINVIKSSEKRRLETISIEINIAWKENVFSSLGL